MASSSGSDLEPGGALAGALFEDLLAALATGEGSEPLPAGGLAGSRVGRLRVERLLAAGGMGEVYEAYDELLERRVALKCLRPDHDATPEARARFLREARLLCRLDHPNVCRLHDLVEHAGGEALVLELLAGETLKSRLDEGPRQSFEAALGIAAQIAAGLAAAHAAGIVHRDLKPSNVMLGAGRQLKLIDFGIARRERQQLPSEPAADEPPGAGETLHTRRGSTLGTPAYMSPEQAGGEELGPPTDVYSLGVLLVELFTGRSAYAARDAAELQARVREAQVEPLDDVAAPVRPLLERMLSVDPAARPTIAEVEARLVELALAPERRARARRQRWLAAALFALVALAGGLVAYAYRPEPSLTAAGPPRLAVLPFANHTGDAALDWVEQGLAEMVAENLATVPGVSVVPSRDVAEMLRQKALTLPVAPADVGAVLAGLGANVALSAEVEAGGAPGAFRLRYQAERPGVEPRARSIEAPDLLAAANELSARLSRRLAPDSLLPALNERFSEVPLANQLHAMGLQRLRLEQGAPAAPFFRVARELDAGFLDAPLRLAEALALQSNWSEAAAEAQHVVAAARALGREDLTTAAYTVLANVAHGRDAREEAVRWGEEAVASAERSGNREGLASAVYAMARSLRFLDPPRGRASFERALVLYRELGHRLGEAKALHALGVMADEAGDTARARQLFDEALVIDRELGAARLEAIVLDSQALVLGRTAPAEAAVLLARAVALEKQVGERRALIMSLGNLGDALHETGDLEAAEARFREAEALCQEVEAPVPCALLGFNFAELLLQTGRHAEALPLIDRAEAVYGADDPDLLLERAMYRAAIGDVAGGRRLLARAIAGVDEQRGREVAQEFAEVLAQRSEGR